ncbi:MAG TPA: hypothetical protein VM260_01150 [Pirellula sp.]|nr:hypothetical protein [Pirellula sp.]
MVSFYFAYQGENDHEAVEDLANVYRGVRGSHWLTNRIDWDNHSAICLRTRFGQYRSKIILAATEAVTAVVTEVAITVADRDRSAAVATWGIALESSELTVARIRLRRTSCYPSSQIIDANKLSLCITITLASYLGTISID